MRLECYLEQYDFAPSPLAPRERQTSSARTVLPVLFWGIFCWEAKRVNNNKCPIFAPRLPEKNKTPTFNAIRNSTQTSGFWVSKLRELELLKHKKKRWKTYHFQCFIVTWSFWKYQGNKKQRQQQLPRKNAPFSPHQHQQKAAILRCPGPTWRWWQVLEVPTHASAIEPRFFAQD